MTLNALLEASAARRPDHVAIEDPERNAAITYRDLNRLADVVKDRLVGAGVRPGDRVGVYAHKSIGTVVSIFGILKAGAAYVPVDPDAPPARGAFIFQDCDVRAILAEAALVDALRGVYNGQGLPEGESLDALSDYGVDLALLQAPIREERSAAEPVENLAYILYTSGSTGAPKGVMHTHASALSFVDWCSETFDPTEEDRFSSHAPFHFDLSILDLYVPLKHGATLVLIGEKLGKQPLALAETIAKRRLSVWYSTPSILRLLVEYGRMQTSDYAALRLVFFAGEVFPIKHLAALKAAWPHPRYFNLYGPTETNVCTYYEVPEVVPEDRTEPFPIGKTCENDRARVMNEQDQDVRPGEEGELYVAGGSVMVGYWNLPERTSKAFYVDDADPAERGQAVRWYKTGDVVKEDEDGDYLFAGRRDRMVKRRGYRVELGEIEATLYRHPDVQEAAVVALPDEEHGVLIKAFLNWDGEGRPSLIKLKRFASENLPLYMIPDRFSFPSALPKTSTDKIDYQRLQEMD
ncbi:MAG: amino acid adenylation domain-containing protein [Rhodothermales bacterium]